MSELDNYVLRRLRADAAHTIALAQCEDAIPHSGLRGRFREILIGNLLGPWLPPFCKCGTGMIIESSNKTRQSTQEDILVIDTSLAPPVFASCNGAEGVFPFNSVLLRIEVKSRITNQGIGEFLDSSSEVLTMNFQKQPDCKGKFDKPYNTLVAFKSDLSDGWDKELRRVFAAMKQRSVSPLSGFVSAFCVVERGYWFLKSFEATTRSWCRLDAPNTEVDRLVWFVCHVSNMAYKAHAERQGRDPAQGLESGIGCLIPTAEIFLVPADEDSG
jgi:hypothetical protein